jgi:hypothetical protein
MATKLWLYGDGDPRIHHKEKIRVPGVSSRPPLTGECKPTWKISDLIAKPRTSGMSDALRRLLRLRST